MASSTQTQQTSKPEPCPTCNGVGLCPNCGGEGEEYTHAPLPVPCHQCGGRGDCPTCHGTGARP